MVQLDTAEFQIRSEELDYNESTGYVEARGNVRFLSYERGETLEASRAEYFLEETRGRFYDVKGTTPATADIRPQLLRTSDPYVFQGKWADRLAGRYILYDGFLTNCRLPRPWWIIRSPKFDIIPGDRALAYRAKFKVRNLTAFYVPVFYKDLKEQPRKSGFLLPSIANSSQRGFMVHGGYYWAINRSYDAAYRGQIFTTRGFGHQVDFRGKPTASSDFDMYLYGVNDRGRLLDDGTRRKQGGVLLDFRGKTELPHGFYARGEVRYLTSLEFRQAFTNSFNEGVTSEVNSIGFAGKDWSTYSLNLVAQRHENYRTLEPGDRIVLRKLPSLEFRSRPRQINERILPVWFSLESSAALVRRNQPLFQTRQFVDRFDAMPRLMTRLRWKDFTLLPSVAVRETRWGSSQTSDGIIGRSVQRHAQEVSIELLAPSVARVFEAPKFLGDRFKHVIETRAGYRRLRGINDFSRYIRFDETELMTNTEEYDYSLTNRIYLKRGDSVWEALSWTLWQKRYLDPTLGGAIVDGQRNVFLTQTAMTPYAFFDTARRQSPIVSALNLQPIPSFNVEWRSDYDPVRSRITNSSLLAGFRTGIYTITAGQNYVRSIPTLSPSANQFVGLIGIGRPSERGWNTSFQTVYDFRTAVMQFASGQVSWNSTCCGLSMQYLRLGFGVRNDTVFRFAFSIANIGSVGTVRRQELIF